MLWTTEVGLLSREQGVFTSMSLSLLPICSSCALDVSEHLHSVSANSIDRDLFQIRMRFGSRDALGDLAQTEPDGVHHVKLEAA